MSDKKSIPLAVLDGADGVLDAGVSASGTSFLLESGQGATFPQPITGAATSDGDAYTLNSTGIQALGVAENDLIYNMTKEEFAVILSVSTDSITTTGLGNSAIWANTDVFVVKPILAYAQKRTGTEITSYEKVLFHNRTTDTLVCTAANRGFDGTTAQSFDAGDHISVMVADSHIQEIQNMLARHARHIHNIMREALTIAGLKTFSTMPKCSVTPAAADDLANKQYVDDNSGGGFSLEGSRDSVSEKRVLLWADVIDSGSYTLQRQDDGGGWSTIATLSHTVATYTDLDWVAGAIEYRVTATDGTGVEQTSNVMKFNSTEYIDTFDVGYFGDSSDGAYNDSGDLARGTVHNFTDFDLTGTLNFTGTGLALIFVDGDLTITSTGIINANAAAVNSLTPTTLTIHGESPIDVSVGYGTSGAGGNGGNGGGHSGSYPTGYGLGGAGGAAETAGLVGLAGQNAGFTPGAAGAAGASGTGRGGGGGGGGGGKGQYANGGYGGYGGAGGTSPNVQSHVVFVVSGNISIAGSSQLNGAGATGGNGSNGQTGGNQPGAYGGQGGGGGGGAGGSNGGDYHFFHGGTYANSASQGLSGGAGGTGGTKGGAGTGAVGAAATDGSAGSSGSAGTVTSYQL